MALKKARTSSGRREKPTRGLMVRHRRQGDSVSSIDRSTPDDERQYIDVEHDTHGTMVTNPNTIPKNP